MPDNKKNNHKPLIYDLSYSELNAWLEGLGQPSYRTHQIWRGIYHNLWSQADHFSNIPPKIRLALFDTFSFTALKPISTQFSSDNETQKTLFHLPDQFPIETVRMRYQKRRTLCISTQSGCGMGCSFCATGQMGFYRNLSSGEIIEQVLYYARTLAPLGERITNIVFMGMGEPFHNYNPVMTAINTMNHPDGMKLGARRFTISTVGLVPAIRRFTKENNQVNLAVSLHASDNDLRSSLLPINKKYPIEDLLAALRNYAEITKRRITFEWALINGVNDTQDQAIKLVHLLKGLLAHVNVIPLNPTASFKGQASSTQQAQTFQTILEAHGISCTIRLRRGIDIQAGCGQLASKVTTHGSLTSS